jgi:hypothetical protein
VLCVVVEAVRGFAQLLAGLSVDQVGRGDIREGLRRLQVSLLQRPGHPPVEVEGAEPAVAVEQGEGEHSRQTRVDGGRGELRKATVVRQVWHRDGLAGLIGSQARALPDRALQAFETQCILVRGGYIARGQVLVDQRDSRRGDGQDLHDAFDQMVEDSLNWEVGDHRASELAQDRREFVPLNHFASSQRCFS